MRFAAFLQNTAENGAAYSRNCLTSALYIKRIVKAMSRLATLCVGYQACLSPKTTGPDIEGLQSHCSWIRAKCNRL